MQAIRRRQALAMGLGTLAHPWVLAQPSVEDETWTDARRSREVPVRVRWPADGAPLPAGGRPVLLFSHGLGGTRDGGTVWGEAWAAAGFVVIHLQHVGSDLEAVRQAAGGFGNRAALRTVAGPRELLQRLGDVVFVLAQVMQRQAQALGRWAGVRPTRVGMSGHSFGAHTTLGVAGQSYPGFAGLSEPRLGAFIAFSPTAPVQAPEQGFAAITRPVLCVTGSRDDDVLGTGASPQQRQAAYAALPPGHKAQLVLQDGDHMTFGGQPGRASEILPREAITRELQPRHHALVAAITTDWWRATLLDDAQARQRLVRPAGLAEGDLWSTG